MGKKSKELLEFMVEMIDTATDTKFLNYMTILLAIIYITEQRYGFMSSYTDLKWVTWAYEVAQDGMKCASTVLIYTLVICPALLFIKLCAPGVLTWIDGLDGKYEEEIPKSFVFLREAEFSFEKLTTLSLRIGILTTEVCALYMGRDAFASFVSMSTISGIAVLDDLRKLILYFLIIMLICDIIRTFNHPNKNAHEEENDLNNASRYSQSKDEDFFVGNGWRERTKENAKYGNESHVDLIHT